MFYDTSRDGVGLDLTPLISAGNSAADAYAKIRAADAAAAAAKRRAPSLIKAGPAPQRRINPIAYLIMGAAVIGGFFVVRRMLGKRRR